MNIADAMLSLATEKRKLYKLVPPALRRQIAGNFENPFDMEHESNRDILLFYLEYVKKYGRLPTYENLQNISLFTAEENMADLSAYLSKL